VKRSGAPASPERLGGATVRAHFDSRCVVPSAIAEGPCPERRADSDVRFPALTPYAELVRLSGVRCLQYADASVKRTDQGGKPVEGGKRIDGKPNGGPPASPELLVRTCLSCGARLEERSCKLICSCGYYASCSDFH